jgi:4-alpha-glucanotransferase
VVYTGTHDTDTTGGWFAALDEKDQERVCDYLRCRPEEAVRVLVRTALASVARYAIIPLQDLLGLDSAARMNLPGLAEGNWEWRVTADYGSGEVAGELHRLSALYNRNSQQ